MSPVREHALCCMTSVETIGDAENRMDEFVREMMLVLLQFLKEKQVES